MGKNNRAVQFAPYAALRGFEEIVREKTRVREDRVTLSDEEGEALSAALSHVRRGMRVRVTYYLSDAYVTKEGRVSAVEPEFMRFTLEKEKIAFADVRRVEFEREKT